MPRVLYSDTGGASWAASAMPGGGATLPGSECQLAIARNGSVLVNCRPFPEQQLSMDGRLAAVSKDGGSSFKFPRIDRALWGADCASGFASMPSAGSGGTALYWSGPRNNNTDCPWCRTHMAVLRSDSDGESWDTDVLSVWHGEAAYSVSQSLILAESEGVTRGEGQDVR